MQQRRWLAWSGGQGKLAGQQSLVLKDEELPLKKGGELGSGNRVNKGPGKESTELKFPFFHRLLVMWL